MKIVVCGAGRVGQGIAGRLSNDGHTVSVIDSDAMLVNRVASNMEVTGIVGHAAHPEVLASAGAEDAEMIVAVTHSDEVNMVTCQVCKTLFDRPRTIARVRSQAYLTKYSRELFVEEGIPIDVVISPEIEVAKSILQRLETPGAFFSATFADGAFKVVGLNVTNDAPIAHTAVDQIGDLFPGLQARVIGYGRGSAVHVMHSNDQLVPGDRAYVALPTDEIDRLLDLFATDVQTTRKVVVVGAGNIGLSVARELEAVRTARVRVLEANLERAEYAAAQLRRAIVVHGDALDPSALEEAGVENADVVIGLTDDDKTNLLLSAMAKRLNAKKTVALVNSEELKEIHSNLDVDIVIDPRSVTISQVLLELKRGRILSLHSIEAGKGEVAEGIVWEGGELIGERLRYGELTEGVVAGALIRDGKVMTIDGKTKAKHGDHVIVFADERREDNLERLFLANANSF